MHDEEEHIDFLETQLDLVAKLGVELYAQHHIGELDDEQGLSGRARSSAGARPLVHNRKQSLIHSGRCAGAAAYCRCPIRASVPLLNAALTIVVKG